MAKIIGVTVGTSMNPQSVIDKTTQAEQIAKNTENISKLSEEFKTYVTPVQSDWNQNDDTALDFIKNRIGGYTKDVTETYIEDEEFEFPKSDITALNITGTNIFEAGNELIIKFDGVEYKVIGLNGPYSQIVFGNQYLTFEMNYPDTGEPFVFYRHIDNPDMLSFKVKDKVTHTVSISKVVGSEIVKIPSEFLDIPDIPDTNNSYAVEYVEQELTEVQQMQARKNLGLYGTDTQRVLWYNLENISSSGNFYPTETILLEEGKNYIIRAEGASGEVTETEWTCTTFRMPRPSNAPGCQIGPNMMESGRSDIGVCHVEGTTSPSYYVNLGTNTDVPYTITVYEVSSSLKTIEEEFIPNTIARKADISGTVEITSEAPEKESTVLTINPSAEEINIYSAEEVDDLLANMGGGSTGGGSEEWELIADITLTEKVNGLLINEDINGNPFELKKAWIRVVKILSEDEGGYAGTLPLVLNGNDATQFVISKQSGTSNVRNISETILESSPLFGTIMVNNVSSYNEDSMAHALVYRSDYNCVRAGVQSTVYPMKSFKIGSAGSIVMMGVGSKVTICGIRA